MPIIIYSFAAHFLVVSYFLFVSIITADCFGILFPNHFNKKIHDFVDYICMKIMNNVIM